MAMHPTDIQPGDEETTVVQCPDCGQMEVWTERERADHGKCRASTDPCWCEE